jgi:hypothetical protein
MIRQVLKTTGFGRFLYGNLKDSDRIFTNVYKDGDPYINGALKRVLHLLYTGRLVSNQGYYW